MADMLNPEATVFRPQNFEPHFSHHREPPCRDDYYSPQYRRDDFYQDRNRDSHMYYGEDELRRHYYELQASKNTYQRREHGTSPVMRFAGRRGQSPPPMDAAPRDVVRISPPKNNEKPKRKSSPQKIDVSYDADCIVNLIRSQLEFYFSDKNLLEETNSNLIFYMLQDYMWVPVNVVCSLPKVRSIGGTKEDVLTALRTSSLLELNEKETKVRRPGYQLPSDYKVRKSLRRSVLVYGLSRQMTDSEVRSLLDSHGHILCVAFPHQGEEGPDIEMGRVIMKKKLGDPPNLMDLTCAFVVFESQSQANKCVKARSRTSPDGIRTMHKYDYNKVVKRLGKGMSPNASPLFTFTPTQSPSPSLSGFNAVERPLKLSPALNAHSSPSFKSRSLSRSPVVRGRSSNRSPFFRGSQGSPNLKGSHSPNWTLNSGEGNAMRARSSSMQNRRVLVAKGPDSTKGFRWHRNPSWQNRTRTTLDVLNTTFV